MDDPERQKAVVRVVTSRNLLRRFPSKLWLTGVLALLIAGPRFRQIAGKADPARNELAEEEVDCPPDEQVALERMVAGRFSTALREEWPGRRELVAAEELMPDYLYSRWHGLLELFDQGGMAVVMGHEATDYFRHLSHAIGRFAAKKQVARFWRTYRSIKAQGFREGSDERPLILIKAGSARVRVDGAHRSSILRHLGFQVFPSYVLGRKDLDLWAPQSEDERRAVEWFLRKGASQEHETPVSTISGYAGRGEMDQSVPGDGSTQ